jgi:DNA-binding transcriptional regulator YiaG
MNKKYESEIAEMCHEEAIGLHEIGAISDTRMKEFDELCLSPNTFDEKYQSVHTPVSYTEQESAYAAAY